jgi:hypothetical protein
VRPYKDSNVLQTEYVTWSRVDKHARAYTVLGTALSLTALKARVLQVLPSAAGGYYTIRERGGHCFAMPGSAEALPSSARW